MQHKDLLLIIAAALLFVWWRGQPRPAIPAVVTSSLWLDPVTNTWREF